MGLILSPPLMFRSRPPFITRKLLISSIYFFGICNGNATNEQAANELNIMAVTELYGSMICQPDQLLAFDRQGVAAGLDIHANPIIIAMIKRIGAG